MLTLHRQFEDFAERMTTFMAFMVVSSLTFTSHHSSDVVALLFYLGLLLRNRLHLGNKNKSQF
jgi:hypothetical protein